MQSIVQKSAKKKPWYGQDNRYHFLQCRAYEGKEAYETQNEY